MQRSSIQLVQPRPSPRLRLAAGLGALGLAALAPADAGALVADCADGSVVLASRWEDVHCVGAVAVEPGATPRLGAARRLETTDRRELRRRHETQRELDLESQIDRARTARGRQRTSLAPAPTLWPDDATPPQPQVPAAFETTPFVLSESEYDALSRFMQLGGDDARVDIARGNRAQGRIRLAHSHAFEAKLHAHLGAAGHARPGTVLVFSIAPHGAPLGEPPHFGQGGETFRPRAPDPTQLGRIVRKEAPTRLPTAWLGYVVLPADFDLERPLALFWGDAVEVARLQR